MKFSAVLALGLAAFALARPAPEAVEERDLAGDLTAALPHPIQASDKIMVPDAPVDLVTKRQAANGTTAATAKKAKSS
jgi:hypothetical protein